MFYTDAFQKKSKLLVSGRNKDGTRFRKEHEILPELFIESSRPSDYKNIYKKDLVQLEVDNLFALKEKVKELEASGITAYYNRRFVSGCLYQHYKDQVVNPSHVKIAYLDIETECEDEQGNAEFPNIETANKRINAITLSVGKEAWVFGLQNFDSTEIETSYKDIHYFNCDGDERVLLKRFVQTWQKLDFDVVSGWNIDHFDIPYIIRRLNVVFGEGTAEHLSPWGIVEDKTIKTRFGDSEDSFTIAGISSIDLLSTYKKFRKANAESFKLDSIAELELGVKKLDYSEYGGQLHLLYKNNYQKFIAYNIRDTELVYDLNRKLKLLQLVFTIAYDALVPYVGAFSQVQTWDCIIANFLRNKNVIVQGTRQDRSSSGIVGGYVKQPKPGMCNWVMTFDYTSMYPTDIMQWNLSPDSKVPWQERNEILVDAYEWHLMEERPAEAAVIKKWLDGDTVDANDLLTISHPLLDPALKISVTAKGILFYHEEGFMSEITSGKFANRQKYKKQMLAHEVELEAVKARIKELENAT